MNYSSLFLSSIFNPINFFSKRIFKVKLMQALWFFMVTIGIGQMLSIFVLAIQTAKLSVIFITVSELIFVIPLSVIGLLIASFILHFIARVLGGKGSSEQSVIAAALSTGPLVLVFLPLTGPFVSFWQVILCTIAFKYVHKYSFGHAIVTTLIPSLLMIFLVSALGLIPSFHFLH